MLVPIDIGRGELKAHGFTLDKKRRDTKGEWWTAPTGYPTVFMQYCGSDDSSFDRDQIDHVLSWRHGYQRGVTIAQ